MLVRFEALKPEYPPGERSTYSNTNYILLGNIIESVTGSRYAEQLCKRITRRIGLRHTRYAGAVNPVHDEAHSFAWGDGRWTRTLEEHPSIAAGTDERDDPVVWTGVY